MRGNGRRVHIRMPQLVAMGSQARGLVQIGIARLAKNELEGAADSFALAADFLYVASERLRMRALRGEGVKSS